MIRFVWTTQNIECVLAVKRREQSRQRWGDMLEALGEEAFGHPVQVFTWTTHRPQPRFAGFRCDDDPLPRGWKKAKTGVIVPDERLKAGKEWSARLTPLSQPERVLVPGIGSSFFGGTEESPGNVYYWQPTVGLLNEELWLAWGTKPEDVDETIWKPRKLSEFYAAQEEAAVDE